MKPTINLPLTIEQANVLRQAVYVAEVNAWQNTPDYWYAKRIAQTLTALRRDLDERKIEARETIGWE